jgi:hypothetical protein
MDKRRTTVTYHGIEWRVEGQYVPGEKAASYERDGSPGHPATASDLLAAEITIYCKQGQSWNRSDEMADILAPDAREKIIAAALAEFDDPDWVEIPV